MGQGWSFLSSPKEKRSEIRLLASPRAKGLFNHWEIEVHGRRYGFHPLGVYKASSPFSQGTKCIKVGSTKHPQDLVDQLSTLLGTSKYLGMHYHPLARNCEHFAKELFQDLSDEAKQLKSLTEPSHRPWPVVPYPHDLGALTVSLAAGVLCPPAGMAMAGAYAVATRVAPPFLARWGFS